MNTQPSHYDIHLVSPQPLRIPALRDMDVMN